MKQIGIIFIFIALFFLLCKPNCAQESIFFEKSDTLNTKRLKYVIGTKTLALSATFVGLNELWYKNYERSSFQFFNDNEEWLQMDKLGHLTTGYAVAQVSSNLFQWTGLEHKKSVLAGSGVSLLLLTGVEVLDGFSAQWGFSYGDMIANVVGVGAYASQEFLWGEQRISFKFSYFPSSTNQDLAELRPALLGSNWTEQWLKNYNDQTYWLSLNLASFSNKEDKKLPWLNLALGYSGNGMLGGFTNIWEKDGITYDYSHISRYRTFYLSPDIDLSRIPTNKKALKTIFKALNFVKIPLPTLSVDEKGRAKAYWIYF